MLSYQRVSELCQAAERVGETISRAVLSDQAQVLEMEEGALYEQMSARLRIMEESARTGMDPALRSASGLSGGGRGENGALCPNGGRRGGLL